MESVMDYLKRRLRQSGRANWRRIAAASGVERKLPEKIVYGLRDNPGIQTIQPLLDYFAAVDRGEIELTAEPRPLPPGQVLLGRTSDGSAVVAEAQ